MNDTKPITVAKYLIEQLRDRCGIHHVFGVPGDFSFPLNDAIAELTQNDDPLKKVTWIGNLNELNAAYSADGYARVKGYGALNTTYMVGELSAINGIAGSFAHSVPIFHMVGIPEWNNLSQLTNHHTMGYDHGSEYAAMHAYEAVTSDAMTIKDARDAKGIIDHLIGCMIRKKKPVYLCIPKCVQESEIIHNDGPFLHEILSLAHERQASMAVNVEDQVPEVTVDELEEIADTIIERISYCQGQTGTSCLAIGSLLKRLDPIVMVKVHRFLEALRLPVVTFPDNKCVIPDQHPLNIGMLSNFIPEDLSFACQMYHQKKLRSSGILAIGSLFTDISPGLKDVKADGISIELRKVTIGVHGYLGVPLEKLVDCLLLKIDNYRAPPDHFKPWASYPHPPEEIPKGQEETADRPGRSLTGISDYTSLTESVKDHLKDGDLLMTDIGTIMMGLVAQHIPKTIQFECQTLWCSIGAATPACFGAAVARRHRGVGGRVVMTTGEGSHCMTLQDMALYFHYSHLLGPVTIINIDNGGYTIEKLLTATPKKINSVYNDLPAIDYSQVVEGLCNGHPSRQNWMIKSVSSEDALRLALVEADRNGHSLYLTVKLDEMCAPAPAKFLIEQLYK